MKIYQSNALILFMQTKQTAQMHLKRQVLKRQKDECLGKRFFFFYFFGVEQRITVTVQ